MYNEDFNDIGRFYDLSPSLANVYAVILIFSKKKQDLGKVGALNIVSATTQLAI